jgi:hypothetical protein
VYWVSRDAVRSFLYCCYAYGLYFLTCDKSSLRHIHDPVLLSLKMKGIRLLFPRFFEYFLKTRFFLGGGGDGMCSVSSFVHEVNFWYFYVISQYRISDSQSSNSHTNATDGYCGLRHSGCAAKNCGEHAVA